jgi:hypothetical protein
LGIVLAEPAEDGSHRVLHRLGGFVINDQPPPLQAFPNPIGRANLLTPLDRFQPPAKVGRCLGDEVEWGVRTVEINVAISRRLPLRA